MNINLNDMRHLFTAVMLGVPASGLPHTVSKFRNMSFTTKITDKGEKVHGRLISIKAYSHEPGKIDQFLFEAWYQENAERSVGPTEYPFDTMCRNRSFGRNDLTNFIDFWVYDKEKCLVSSAVDGPWSPPLRGMPATAHVGNVFNHYGNGPGSPYYQQPGLFPGQQPGFQQPNFNPQFHQPPQPTFSRPGTADIYQRTVLEHYTNGRRMVRDKWVEKNCPLERQFVAEVARKVIQGVTELEILTWRSDRNDTCVTGLGAKELIDSEISETAAVVLNDMFTENLEGTGVRVFLQLVRGQENQEKQALAVYVMVN